MLSEERPSLDRFAAKSQAALSEANLPRPIRNSNRRAPSSGFDLQMAIGGNRHSFALLDISNRGFAVRLPASIDLESLLPGHRVSGISIFSFGREVLGGVDTLVRRLTVCRVGPTDPPGGYELGLEFVSERRTQRTEGQTAELRTPARIAEVIEEGLRSGISVSRLDGAAEPALFLEGRADLSAGLVHLYGESSDDLRSGDAVRVTCDVTGFSCSFFTAVVQDEVRLVALADASASPRHQDSPCAFDPSPPTGSGQRHRGRTPIAFRHGAFEDGGARHQQLGRQLRSR